VQRIHNSEDGCGMKPKPFEIIVEFTPQSTKTGITYEAHQKGSLIRCEDCKWYGRVDKRRFYRGADCLQGHIHTIVPERDYCSRAEPKGTEQ
jgi:hypothetical protein